jgi:hypothetical protein
MIFEHNSKAVQVSSEKWSKEYRGFLGRLAKSIPKNIQRFFFNVFQIEDRKAKRGSRSPNCCGHGRGTSGCEGSAWPQG